MGYVIGLDTLYRTEDGGATWQRVLVPLPLPSGTSVFYSRLLLPFPGVTEPERLVAPVVAWWQQTYGEGQPPVPATVAGLALRPLSERIAMGHEATAWCSPRTAATTGLVVTFPGRILVVGCGTECSDMLRYAAPGFGQVYRSPDGAQSWHLRGDVGYAAGPIAFPTAEVGYATGPIPQPQYPYGYGLSKTEDAGATWRRLETQVPGRATGLTFLSEQHGFVAGEKGILMRTVDGGETWTQPSLSVKPMLAPPIFPTPEVGYAVGSRSTILKTTDGGANWTVQTHGSARFERAFER